MTKITIDGREYEVSDGLSAVQAAAEVGVLIPHYCYHPALPAPANCRMCLIELTPPGAPGPLRQLATACTTRVADGMVITTNSPRVKRGREMTLEFLLIHHPLDCPTCDEAGECDLQDFTFLFGPDRSKYQEAKRVPPRKTLGPYVEIFKTRCIVCTRCVRFTEEISGTRELCLVNRGVHDEIDIYPGRELNNKLSGNVVDLCPVGALLSRDFLYRSRPWFLQKVNSICPRCSKGCNITVEYRDGEVVRLRPRYNGEVNDFWMCDDGRFGYHYLNSPQRLRRPMVRQEGEEPEPTVWPQFFDAMERAVGELGGEQFAVVASAWNTNEELYLIRRFADEVLRTKRLGLLAAPIGQEERFPKFVIEGDKNPNRTGAQLILGEAVSTDDALWEMLAEAKGALIFGGIPELSLPERAREILAGLEFLAVVDILPSELTALAEWILPGTGFTEKEGCFTNSQRRVQALERAMEPLGNALPEWQLLSYLANVLGADWSYSSVRQITQELAETVSAFEGATPETIGKRGYVLGSGPKPPETPLKGNDAYAAMFWP